MFSRPGRIQGLLYKHLCHSLILWLSDPFVKLSLRRRNAQTVKYDASSQKTNYIEMFQKFSILRGIETAVLVQKLRRFCYMGKFSLLFELHREGSALQPTQQACLYDLGGKISVDWKL